MRLPKQTLSLTLLPPAALWAEEKRCLTLAPAQRRRSQSRRLTRLLSQLDSPGTPACTSSRPQP